MWSRYGAPMIDPTVLRGFSEANGSWKIICISRRSVPEIAALGVGDVLALELDRALGRVVQAHHHAGERRLAAPRLPHQPERLALVDLQVDAVDRVHVADPLLEQDPSGDREQLAEAADPDERRLRSLAGRGCRSFGHLDAHERAITSSWKMRSLSASDRWHARRVVAVGREQLGHLASGTGRTRGGSAGGTRSPGGTKISDGGSPRIGIRRSFDVAVVQPRDRRQEPPRVRMVRAVVDVAAVARSRRSCPRTSPGCGRSVRRRRRGRA